MCNDASFQNGIRPMPVLLKATGVLALTMSHASNLSLTLKRT